MQNFLVFSDMKYIHCVLNKVVETFGQLYKLIERGVGVAVGTWIKCLTLWQINKVILAMSMN